jgi:hypothetical protein
VSDDGQYFRVHVQTLRRESFCTVSLSRVDPFASELMMMFIHRFGFVNAFGVSDLYISFWLANADHEGNGECSRSFKDHYQNILLKDTLPSTMYVISRTFFFCSDIQSCYLVP